MEGGAFHTDLLGGVGDVVVVFDQFAEDVLTLEGGPGILQVWVVEGRRHGNGSDGGDGGGQVLDGDLVAGREDDHPLDHVFQFTDVAGPGVVDQGLEHLFVDLLDVEP